TPTETCITEGYDCGNPLDDCGTPLNCGTCTGTDTCESYVCTSCTPDNETVACDGFECGTADDGCEGLIDCTDACDPEDVCEDNLCVSPPTATTGDSVFTAYFSDNGVPETGLASATIDIYRISDNATKLVVDDGVLTELGGGFYTHAHTTEDNASFVSVGDAGAVITERYVQCISTIIERKIDDVLVDTWGLGEQTDTIEVNTELTVTDTGNIYTTTNNTQADVTDLKTDTAIIINDVAGVQTGTTAIIADVAVVDANV
ncbi:unnamed protein product, partial [marine sediment metagenome]